MSKQVRLPLNNKDVSRFFNNSVYNRSIKLWVNNTCFTCSRLILAQHSSIFEQHLRDSPPSVLLDDFQDVEGAESGIQDALILLYGGAVQIGIRNISVLSKFASTYNIKELLKVCMDWVKHNLSVETVMMFFKALKTEDKDGVLEIPDMIRKFMEEKTGPIVDHLLSSSDNIDDEFLLAMLELPSSSLLVQRCLKSGVLPDPIVDLIFKHSNTINVNFLLHDDKRTYVRLITILKSKARSYKDMEKIIDIQQKCISKMCHPYGSVDSLAMGDIAPAPSMVGGYHKPPTAFQSELPRVREEYQPKSLGHFASTRGRPPPTLSSDDAFSSIRGRPQNNSTEDSDYMMPEELKHRQNNPDHSRPGGLPDSRGSYRETRHENGTQFGRGYNRDDDRNGEFSSRDRSPTPRDRLPPAVVAQLKQNLEKNFVPKYPDEKLNPAKYSDDRYDCFSDAETYLDDRGRGEVAVATDGVKAVSLTRLHKKAGVLHGTANVEQKTNYAQVYMKKANLNTGDHESKSAFENPHLTNKSHVNPSDPEMARALNKLAEQQAIIEHTYDNMSILSFRPEQAEKPPPEKESKSRKRTNSGPKESSRATAHDPPTAFQRSTAPVETLQAPIHIPTTFGTTGSTRGSVRSNRAPSPPSNPPPGATSFFAGGTQEAKSPPLTRPPPALQVPPPPPDIVPDPVIPEINIESISGLDSGCYPDMPPDCIPEYDKVSSPPVTTKTPPAAHSVSSHPPMSPPAHSYHSSQPFSSDENYDRGREQAPRGRPGKIQIPDLNPKTGGMALTQEELFMQSAVLLNKRSRSKSKERTKDRSKERSKSKERNKGSVRRRKSDKNKSAEEGGKLRVMQ